MTDPSTTPRTQLEVPVVPVPLALGARDAVVIDLRSPKEFAEDHVPGAHNIPLFDDAERAIVGTLYKQESSAAAFRAGTEFVREGIGQLVEDVAAACDWSPESGDLREHVTEMTEGGIQKLEAGLRSVPLAEVPERVVVLHCWRGGLRSQSVIALLRTLGLERAVGLEGGYKAYRRNTMDALDDWQAPSPFVIRGLTGVGKTLILRALEELRPGWTLDLEACAGHRSSLLGMVGLEPCTQKTFETRLAARLREGFPGPVVFEGESRKVGDAIIPRGVWEPVARGVNLKIEAPLERRIQVLSEDYMGTEAGRRELPSQLAIVEGRMDGDFPLVRLYEEGRIDELVAVLLEHYYDPLYRHSEKGREYAATFTTTDQRETAGEIARWIEDALS